MIVKEIAKPHVLVFQPNHWRWLRVFIQANVHLSVVSVDCLKKKKKKAHGFVQLKKKFNQVNLEDLIDFIKPFMNWAVPQLASRGRSKELYKMESFYRKRVGTRKILTKEKDCSRGAQFLEGKQGVSLYILHHYLWGVESSLVRDPVWTEKFLADQSRLHFWRKLKQQLVYVLGTILILWVFWLVLFSNSIYFYFHRYIYVLLCFIKYKFMFSWDHGDNLFISYS